MAKLTPEQLEAVTVRSEKPYRMVFANVVTAKPPRTENGEAKPEYSGTFNIPKDDPLYCGDGKSLLRVALSVAKRDFLPVYAEVVTALKGKNETPTVHNMLAGLKAAGVNFPFIAGEEANTERRRNGRSEYPWAPGHILFKAKSGANAAEGKDYPPDLGSLASGKGVAFSRAEAKANEDMFYPGAEAFFRVKFDAFTVSGKRYVKAYLQRVFVTGKGERLGGGAGAEEFDKFLGNHSAVNPLDDESDPLAGL